MNFSELKNVVADRKDINMAKVEQAYVFAKGAHEGQFRNSGKPYIVHPLAVAHMVASYGGDEESIIAALLHDVVEDTEVTEDEIEKIFGKGVAQLVHGLTKICSSKTQSKEENKIESLKKWFDVMKSDIRIAVIKLFDRLHNMQTLQGHKKPEKRIRIAEETLRLYVKVAKNLSMNRVKRELESLSILYLDTPSYDFYKRVRKKEYGEMKKILKEIEFRVHSADYQEKLKSIRYESIPPLFIYKHKLNNRASFKGIIPYVFVLTTKTIEECYYLLFLIHSLWKGKPGFFKDFITTPRSNGGKELRTTVLLENGAQVQFKIRTKEMDEYCQRGITKFCFSKFRPKHPMPWLRHSSYIMNINTHDMFLEQLQSDLMGKAINIYTDKDEPILIPVKSTLLDAAFYIYGKKALKVKNVTVNGFQAKLENTVIENSVIHFDFARTNMVQTNWQQKAHTALASSILKKNININIKKKKLGETPLPLAS
jgi:(p)ppGpp synthase/HD superfamily hydrolase